ncbi:HNH endonuclease [Gryllotalpicola protaetiae]|uniref:HNH endonuclease n=1 Tax=Gryllotalpicola protaetiae TaxID=2419771 RepID=A0A387BFM1_9MICO|nr:HNH endonuclease [Gryllotalpicola protaetiae]
MVASALPCAEQIAQLRDPDVIALMAELGALARKVAATSSLAATDIDRRSARELGAAGLAQSNGLRNGPEFVQKLTGSSIAEARKLVHTGGLLETAESVVPVTGSEPGPRDLAALEALPGGWEAPIAVAVRNEWLSVDQSEALRSGLGSPRSAGLADDWRHAALALIDAAWASEWTAEDLGRAAGRVRASLDAKAADADASARFEARSLKRRQLRSGNWKWDLELDPETDAALWGPLSRRLSPRLGGPRFRTEEEIARAAELDQDPRTNEQLLVDEFTGIFAAGVAAEAAAGAFGKAEPHVSIVVTTDELRKAKDATPGDAAGVAWVGGGQPVSARAALRSICTGTFTPALFDESGAAIDVGRDQRLFTAKQRRAMAVRDGGCRWPGCTRPPGECEAHHDNPWGESPLNRKTETKDGILLCKFHHLTVHNHGARISRQGSVYFLHWPGRPPVPLSSKSGVMAQLDVATRQGA